MGFLLSFILPVLILLIVSPRGAVASHGEVLGVENLTKNLNTGLFEGPGILLPDSPLYFVDIWRDNLSLILASFTPEKKAKLHLRIAAEKITEIKILIEEKGIEARGLDTALSNITSNVSGARRVIERQKGLGADVRKLAEELNVTINEQKFALRVLQDAVDYPTSLKLLAAEKGMRLDEAEIEDELMQDLLQNEIRDEIAREIEKETQFASRSAARIKKLQEQQQLLGATPTATSTPTPKQSRP